VARVETDCGKLGIIVEFSETRHGDALRDRDPIGMRLHAMIATRSMIKRQRHFRLPGVLRRLPPRSQGFVSVSARCAVPFE